MYEARLKIFLVLMALGVAVLILRLADLQLLRGQSQRQLSNKQFVFTELLSTVRGQVRDRHGNVLATDEACFDFCLEYPMLVLDHEQTPAKVGWTAQQVRRIARNEGLGEDQARAEFLRRVEQTWQIAQEITGATHNEMARAAERVVARVKNIRRIVNAGPHPGAIMEESQAHPIVAGIDEPTAVALRARLGEMVGAVVRPSHRRVYPYGDAACHIIGLLGEVEAEQVASRSSQVSLAERLDEYLEGDQIGKCGVEKLCEGLLKGRRGYRRLHRSGELLRESRPLPGQDVRLTIDINLQRDLAALLGKPGAIVVLDVPSGAVLAAVSLPTYDLNSYRKQFEKLVADQADLPLLNKALAVRYPPGSTCKAIAACSALSIGVITPSTIFHCPGYKLHPGEGGLRCDRRDGHGDLQLFEAIKRSCNVFFCDVGEAMGLARLSDWMGRFGLADPPGTGLPEERAGVLPNPQQVPRAEAGTAAMLLAIGQGRVTATPMHLANAMAAIARGGQFCTPLLVQELTDAQRWRDLHLSGEAVRAVQDGLRAVVNEPGGTGYNFVRDSEFEIAGKTGTAQTEARWTDSNGNGRKDEGEILRAGDTAWFVGYAPARGPRIAFAVMVEYSSEHGGAVCGPIAREMVRACRKHGYMD